jgi:tripartite-type tricarboxylate transporter receptor subunit TctC
LHHDRSYPIHFLYAHTEIKQSQSDLLIGQTNKGDFMSNISRRSLLATGALALTGLSAQAQTQADKPIRILVGYSPGGPTDILARMFGERLSKSLGQVVIVENVPGANGDIAARQLLAQPADGYTLMWGPTAQLIFNPATQKNVRFDPVRDFTMIAVACGYAYVAVAPTRIPANDMRQFIEYARQNPGKLSFASAGGGTGNHLAGEWVNMVGKTDLTHVPYKGDAASVADVVSGNVALTFCAPNVAIPMIQAGKLKALAVTSPKRLQGLAEVPTLQEQGFDFTMELLSGLVGRAGMAPDVVRRLNQAIQDAAKDPSVIERLGKMAHYPMAGTPEVFHNLVSNQIQRWRGFMKTANIPLVE